MGKYNTIIVGAGPAGLRAARVLAEAGKNVLVLEKNRIIGQTICAGGLTIRDMKFVPKSLIDAEFNYMLLTSDTYSDTAGYSRTGVYLDRDGWMDGEGCIDETQPR